MMVWGPKARGVVGVVMASWASAAAVWGSSAAACWSSLEAVRTAGLGTAGVCGVRAMVIGSEGAPERWSAMWCVVIVGCWGGECYRQAAGPSSFEALAQLQLH